MAKTGGNEAVYQAADDIFAAGACKFSGVDRSLFNYEITWLKVMTNVASMPAVAAALAADGIVVLDLYNREKWHAAANAAFFTLGMRSDPFKRGWIRVPVVTATLPATAVASTPTDQPPRFYSAEVPYHNRTANVKDTVLSTACVDLWRGRPGTKIGFLQQDALLALRHCTGPRFDGDPTTADTLTPGHASQVVDLDPAAITEDSSACSAALKHGLQQQISTQLLHSKVEQARTQDTEAYADNFTEARSEHPGWFTNNKPVPTDKTALEHIANMHQRNIQELVELSALVLAMPVTDLRAYFGTSFTDPAVHESDQAPAFQTTIVTTNNAAIAAVLTALSPIMAGSRTGPLSNMPDQLRVTSEHSGVTVHYQLVYNRDEAAYLAAQYKKVLVQLRKPQSADFTSSTVAGQALVFH